MPPLDLPALIHLAATEGVSGLTPYLVVLASGFLVGAWGQAARAPIAVVAGILLIILAILGMYAEHGSG